MTTEQLNLIAGVFASIGTIIGTWFLIAKLIAPLFKRTNQLFNTWESFIRDWAGEEAGPGRDRIPGVMERLNEIDGQLKNNGGSSVKDAVDRIEIRVNEIDDRLLDGDKKFQKIEKLLKDLGVKLDNS